jgi:arylsulfatase A-like enzyme
VRLSTRLVLGLGLGMTACGGRPSVPPAADASVLLVTLDTLRADRLGPYGRANLTPRLDAFAARGVVFAEGLASVPLTLPSHATILSGLEPPRHGVHDNGTYVFPENLDTFATLLKAQGYATGAFVGAYVLDRRFGLARGFDVYDDHIERSVAGASVLESERPCESVVAAARDWMGAQQGRFAAWVHLYDAHAPYAPPAAFRDAHPDQPYDGEVAHLDACMGALLEAAGPRVLTSVLADHGEALGEHGEPTHGFFLYQPTLRIPFLMAGPGIPRGERRAGLARTRDVLPTLLGRLGVPAPDALDGVDLFAHEPVTEAYAESLYPATFGWAPLRSFRSGRFKRIEAPRAELFDLTADPGESHDLLEHEPQTAERLKSALARFRGQERPASLTPAEPEVAERLKSLGYVAGSPASVPGEALGTDPKEALPLFRAFEDASWAAARGEHAAAVRGLTPLVRREPGNPVFRRSLAASLRALGREHEAVATLDGLGSGAAGADAAAWHERSLGLAQAGRVEEAIASEERALALNPRLPEPLVHLGVLEAGRGRLPEALRAFEAATRLDPNNAIAWNNQGNALRALGRGAEAEAAYRRAAALAPGDPDPQNGLGTLLVQAGRLSEAEALFARLVRARPDHAEARLNLAVVLARQGRPGEARRELDTILASAASPELKTRARGLGQVLQSGN